MTTLKDHPTVIQFMQTRDATTEAARPPLDAKWLRQLCLDAGADDVGFVEIDRPEIADQREEIRAFFPRARTLISFVCRMNREPVRSPARSLANLEFHHTGDEVNEVGRRIVAALEARNVRAVNPAMGFPMEMANFPGKTWVISHKPVAVAAGLGQMGIHRNVIHPQFGNFILLGTILLNVEVTTVTQPIDYNPCLECKLCVAACPVGAIETDGSFDFAACYTHNYREFMGGFTDWVETIADSKDAQEYRDRVSDGETASMWQSLSFGANYKAAYCMAVCPAGEDVIGPFLTDRPGFLQEVVKPLQQKEETVYVLSNSDAEAHVTRRFPHKQAKRIQNGLRAHSIPAFLRNLHLVFQKTGAGDLAATYHFTFTGAENGANITATVVIRDQTLHVESGHVGRADLRVTADSETWLKFLRGEANLLWALLRRKVRLNGSPLLLRDFGRCFSL